MQEKVEKQRRNVRSTILQLYNSTTLQLYLPCTRDLAKSSPVQILTVVIGIIFVLLLLSLLATTLMELLSSLFSLRGRNLTRALKNMLARSDPNQTLVREFQQNSLYRHLTEQQGRRQQGAFAAPSYINSETFQSILMDVILKGDDPSRLPERIAALPDADLRNVLQQFYRESRGQEDMFRLQIQNWYNNVMDRASGWYKRFIQKILLFMGLGIALLFNADTVALYDRLSNDPETLETIALAADRYVRAREGYSGADRPAPYQPPVDAEYDGSYDLPPDPDIAGSGPANNPYFDGYQDYEVDGYEPADPGPDAYGDYDAAGVGEAEFEQSLATLRTLLHNELTEVRRPLGLGWEGIRLRDLSLYQWMTKLLGFILTALAVSLGAPFWFDLLKKLVNIRSAGARPYENTPY